MSQRIIDRRIRVVVGKPGEQGFEITDLRTSFKIKKNEGSKPNTAEITIYNLSRQSAEKTRGADLVVQVFAGYGDVTPLIFLGAVTRSATTNEGTETITKIESGKALVKTPPVAKTFKGTQKLTGILGAIAEPLEGIVTDLTGVPDVNVSAPRGIRLSGPIRKVLNKYTVANGLDWYIEDGVLRILARGEPYNTQAVLLTPDSGLIGSPKPVQVSEKESGRAAVTIVSTLNGELRPRRILAVDGVQNHAGWYLIRSVEHVGDLWGEFRTACEATPIQRRSV